MSEDQAIDVFSFGISIFEGMALDFAWGTDFDPYSIGKRITQGKYWKNLF